MDGVAWALAHQQFRELHVKQDSYSAGYSSMELNRSSDFQERIENYLERSSYHVFDGVRAKRAGWMAWETAHQKWLQEKIRIKNNVMNLLLKFLIFKVNIGLPS
ncbi:hypothetical protein ACJ67_00055 [Methylophilus sp. TWE2]|nr:hypothetical protein ACJ67_00055 [Methylophilus sp. TWE2]